MSPRGLVISAGQSTDTSAYTHRLRELARCLEERSIPCDFLFMSDSAALKTITAASIGMLLKLPLLRKYDFLYCGDEEAGQAVFFCRPFLRGTVIYDIHGDVCAQSALANEVRTEGMRRTPLLRVRAFHWMGLKAADHYLTVSVPQMETLLKDGVPQGRVSLIRNGVDLGLFRRLPFPETPEFTFGYVGDLQVWQGIDNLIRAFEMIPPPRPRLLLVGFRAEDRAYKESLQERFRDEITAVDRTDRAHLISLLESVAVPIIPRIEHPAIRHAFPTKFGEFAALGRPIMVNDVDETADFVHRFGCGFVSKPSPEAMAKTMVRIAGESLDRLAEMGARARTVAEEEFSWDRIGARYAELVRRVVGQRRR